MTQSLFQLPSGDEMDRAFRSRDASYDGVFFVGVRTTGVFCRPSCPARKPLPENVQYFPTAREALFAGYRACRRCRPLAAGDPLPEWAEALIARVDADPKARIRDEDLRAMDLDPARVRRLFLRRYGMTFQAFCRARRLASAFDQIRNGTPLDDAVFEHGFESHSGFRDAFGKLFGEPPRRGVAGDYLRVAWIDTPLGPMIAGATTSGLCLLEFTDRRMLEAQVDTLRRRFGLAAAPGESPVFDRLRRELGEYFAGARTQFTVPLVYPGSEFQVRVWDELLKIPCGETRNYEELAVAIGRPGASRAVGHANGQNRIAILIPCHRVVNKSGELGGYGGGLWRKHRLLELERGLRNAGHGRN